MKRWHILFFFALIFILSYVGPSDAGSVNLTAADCAAHDARC